ncbi:hypothetical protein PV10_07960 [Exophiala mesophila]|uniref:Uncharacterized protein n=1 Tax=Exophiala mesophila TaxID=212818 RepID=A0A0D1ZN88_EXOME|nr:uncharacterized protein PV10_07960 [Exophiala mesophila]KIV88263.1 hypothetical protein PV10_07960 [Exophiala mesophila]
MASNLIFAHPCFFHSVYARCSPTSTRFLDNLPWFNCYAFLPLKQIHSMECFSETTSSTDSSCKSSSRIRYVPGTPKPPIEPPRRRSSLFFARVLQHNCSPITPSPSPTADEKAMFGKNTPPNNHDLLVGCSPAEKSLTTPGHVAQMQKLFQSAKASLRMDIRFAASPAGSIDSRIPTSSTKPASSPDGSPPIPDTNSKSWRYSTAPKFLAEVELDVREPFPQVSPQLPDLPDSDLDQAEGLASEPLSSGFTSPTCRRMMLNKSYDSEQSRSRATLDTNASPESSAISLDAAFDQSNLDGHRFQNSYFPEDLTKPMTTLRVTNERELDVDSGDNSPIIMHQQRKSGGIHGQSSLVVNGSDDSITLSAPAKAAATSAKAKRGILSGLFADPSVGKRSPASMSYERQDTTTLDSAGCPDPSVHLHSQLVLCPEPGLHFASSFTPAKCARFDGRGGPAAMVIDPNNNPRYPSLGVSQPRVTANGSPTPAFKVKSTTSPDGLRRQSHDSWYSSPPLPGSRQYHNRPGSSKRFYTSTANEHFQPGWYYARENRNESKPPGQAMYSFSTAAAKRVGRDPAPASRIRDAYRTDTLTPLAKPPSRYKKHGIIALANSRGVGKYYGRSAYTAQTCQVASSGPRFSEDVRFRSSPPNSIVDPSEFSQVRKRGRGAETSPIDMVRESVINEDEEDANHDLMLEEGEEVMEVDEETQAAVRMSLYGDPGRGGMVKPLNSNVTSWRKGRGRDGSRKKRRPSYWDGDLKEIVRSPAARHIVSSPIRKDDVKSQQAEVEWHD